MDHCCCLALCLVFLSVFVSAQRDTGAPSLVKEWVAAVEKDAENADHWAALGMHMTEEEAVHVSQEPFTKKEALIHALELDPKHSASWANLGLLLQRDGEEVDVGGTMFGRQKCFVRSLELEPDAPKLWTNLGASLKKNEVVAVNGRNYNERQCYIETLKQNSTAGAPYINLAAMMDSDKPSTTIKVQGEKYTQIALLAKALEVEPTLGTAWFALAEYLSSQPKPDTAKATLADGVKYSAVDAMRKGLEVDPENGEGWFLLGTRMGTSSASMTSASINGKSYDAKECLVQAVSAPAQYRLLHQRKAWVNLALSLTAQGETVTIESKPYTRQMCYVQAVVGTMIQPSKAKTCDDQLGDDATCDADEANFLPTGAAQLDLTPKELAETWGMLAATIKPNSHIPFPKQTSAGGGTQLSAREAYAQALSRSPSSCKLWTNLGANLQGTSTRIGKKRYTQKTAYLRALQCDPLDSRTWTNLGLALGTKEVISVPAKIVDAVTATFLPKDKDSKEDKNKQEEKEQSTDKPKAKDTTKKEETVRLDKVSVVIKAIESSGPEPPEKATAKSPPKNPDQAKLWLMLGTVLPMGTDQVRLETVYTRQYDKRSALVQAIVYDPVEPRAWLTLAIVLPPEAKVDIRGKSMNYLDCVEKAVELNPEDGRAWAILTMSFPADKPSVVTIAGRKWTLEECAAKGKQYLPPDWRLKRDEVARAKERHMRQMRLPEEDDEEDE